MSVNIKYSFVFKLGCFSMFSLIAMGARYGHKGKLDEDGAALFHKGQLYHMANNIGLIASSMISPASLPLKIAIGGFVGGTLIFVCPLYYMAVKGRNQLISKTMPIGGFSMILGWLSLIFA